MFCMFLTEPIKELLMPLQIVGLSPDNVILIILRYGNTTATKIPLCIWDNRKELNKGDLIVLAAFGGGFTWGATLVKWEY